MAICLAVGYTETSPHLTLSDELEARLHHSEGEPTGEPEAVDSSHCVTVLGGQLEWKLAPGSLVQSC